MAGKPGKTQSNKSGARHSAGDQQHLNDAHDSVVKAGAVCASAGKSAKSIPAGVNPGYYAQAEGWDIAQAASALSATAQLASAEIDDADVTDIAPLVASMRSLVKFISGEIDDLEEGAKADAAEDTAAGMSMDMPNSDTPATYPASVVDISAGKAWGFSYIKSLHLPHDEQFFRDVLAVKSVDGKDTIRHYISLWGTPDLTDIESEFFTGKPQKNIVLPPTDFWDEVMPLPKVLTWDHAQDPSFKADPRIGVTVEYGDDELGRWGVSQLKRNHTYRKEIDKLISKRNLSGAVVGPSSDTVPQYMERVPQKNGSTWLKSWPWVGTALTTTPCEPRMLEIGSPSWKSLGLTLPAASDGARRSGESGPAAELLRDYEYLKLNL